MKLVSLLPFLLLITVTLALARSLDSPAAPSPSPVPAATVSSNTARYALKKSHGITAALSYGIILPFYFILTFLLRRTDLNGLRLPRWIVITITVLLYLALLSGIASLILGGVAHGKSKHFPSIAHLVIGIIIVVLMSNALEGECCGGCQGECEMQWEILGWLHGFVLYSLCIAEMFIGFSMMDTPKAWRIAYIVFVSLLGLSSLYGIMT